MLRNFSFVMQHHKQQDMRKENSFSKQYPRACNTYHITMLIKMLDRRTTYHPDINFFDAQLLTTLEKVYK